MYHVLIVAPVGVYPNYTQQAPPVNWKNHHFAHESSRKGRFGGPIFGRSLKLQFGRYRQPHFQTHHVVVPSQE